MCSGGKLPRNVRLINRLTGTLRGRDIINIIRVRPYDRFRELGTYRANSRVALCGWSRPGRAGGWSAGKWKSEIRTVKRPIIIRRQCCYSVLVGVVAIPRSPARRQRRQQEPYASPTWLSVGHGCYSSKKLLKLIAVLH
uniref:Uncharacterized protein n=1 Tax=Schizaphis graminum TaxID=13262 RepID=A0A2S2NKM9_SCHGA